MLAEFIQTIAGMARRETEAHVVDVGNPGKFVVNVGGSLQEYERPDPLVDVTVDSLPSLVLATDGLLEGEVFVGRDCVTFLPDGKSRRDVVRMPLPRTKRFQSLEGLEQHAVMFTPNEAVRLLRFELHGIGTEADQVLQALRRVDFSRQSSGKRTVEHGAESLGRSVEAKVQAANDVPETFEVSAPVWLTHGLDNIEARVRIGVHLDVEQERVAFRVLDDEIQTALTKARIAARNRIDDAADVKRIYLGEPQNIGPDAR